MTKHLPGGPQSPLLNSLGDNMTLDGATRLCAKIKAFWNKRGKLPNVWVQQSQIPGVSVDTLIYTVRSDMVGGRPL